jgi:hypothetical protein
MDSIEFYIDETARRLGVTSKHLRVLERESRTLSACRDHNGRVYSAFAIALLRSMGVGQQPRKLKRADETLEALR